MNESLFVECANWIDENKKGVEWWTPYVLTEHNPNPNPHVNIDQAYDIFAELNRRRLMIHTMVQTKVDDKGITFPAFKINSVKNDNWQQLIKKSGWVDLKLIPGSLWLLKHIWLLALFISGVVITTKVGLLLSPEEPPIRLDESQFESILRLQEQPKPVPPQYLQF